ncbi:MAG: hypothetical protein K2K83_04945, partial [Rikenella sp.]|nr:hypothetical protein [Rikenella sp.]
PAPGLRGNSSGELWFVGDIAFNWSSSIPLNSNSAHYLNCNYSGIYPNNNGYGRSYGFPLRCLQE